MNWKKGLKITIGVIAVFVVLNGSFVIALHKTDGFFNQTNFTLQYIFDKLLSRILLLTAYISVALYCFNAVEKKYPIMLFILWFLYLVIVTAIYSTELH